METDWHACSVCECDANGGLSGVALLGRRFNDGPAVVPIKKRRIQMAEVVRSPSSRPRSPSPVIEFPPPRFALPRSPSLPLKSPPFRSPSLPPLSPRSVSLGYKLSDGDGDSTVTQSIGSLRRGRTHEMEEQGIIPCSVSPKPPASLSEMVDSYEAEDEENARRIVKKMFDMLGESSKESTRQASGHDANDEVDCGASLAGEGAQGKLTRSDLGCSHDVQPCSDLNMETRSWDMPRDQAVEDEAEISKGSREALGISYSVDSDESMRGKRKDASIVDVVKAEVDDESETEELVDYEQSDCRNVNDIIVQNNDRVPMALQDESDWRTEAAAGNLECDASAHNLEPDSPFCWKGEAASGKAYEESRMQEEIQDVAQDNHMLELRLKEQAPSIRIKATSWDDDLPEELEAEEHVDYGDLDCRDADDMVEERTSRALQVDRKRKVEEESGNLEAGNMCTWEGEGFSDVSETEVDSGNQVTNFKGSVCDTRPLETQFTKCGKPEKTKSTGWDRLPEGFDCAEKALKHSFSVCDRGRLWAASRGRRSMHGSQGALHGSRWGSVRGAFRDFSQARADGFFGETPHFDGRPMSDGVDASLKFASCPNIGRGRNSGRGRSARIHGRGRAGGWIDTQGSSLGHWVPGRRRLTTGFGSQASANAAAVAAAKVESNGFTVTNDGTVTKSGREATSCMLLGGCVPCHNVGMNPSLEIDVGAYFPNKIGGLAKKHFGSLGHKRHGLTGRKDRYQMLPFGSGAESRRRQSTHRSMHPLDHHKLLGHSSASFRSESRVERSRAPLSHEPLGHQWNTSFSKWSSEKTDAFWEQDLKQPLACSPTPPRRAPPCVVHGSTFKNKWDGHLSAGPKYPSPAGKSRVGTRDVCHSKQDERKEIRVTSLRSRGGDQSKINPRGGGNDRDNRAVNKGDTARDGDRSDFITLSSKDAMFTSSHKRKYASWGSNYNVPPRGQHPS